MKRLIIISTFLLFGLSVNIAVAQVSEQGNQTLTRAEKKAAKKKQEEKEYLMVNKLVNDSSFVFLGRQWYDSKRGSVNIDPTINFLIIKGEKAFFQFGFDNAGPGLNGLGGASYKGSVVSYKFKQGKNSNKASDLLVTIKPDYYPSTITFSLSFFGASANMSFSGRSGRRITMDGSIYAPDKVNMLGSGSDYK